RTLLCVPVGRFKVSRRTQSTSMNDRRIGRPRQILVSLLCLLALAYFVYHAIVGKRGLEARSRLIERSRQLEPEIGRLEALRARLERDVRLLDIRDPDIVEELEAPDLRLQLTGAFDQSR